MNKLLLPLVVLSLLAVSVSAYHTYDYSRSGYVLPGYMNVQVDQGVQITKSANAYYSPVSRADFRKSAFRPLTYATLGSQGAGANARTIADTGAGLYVPYQYGNEMPSQIINIRNRMAFGPYYGAYGVEKQVIKPFTFGSSRAAVSNTMPVPGQDAQETIAN